MIPDTSTRKDHTMTYTTKSGTYTIHHLAPKHVICDYTDNRTGHTMRIQISKAKWTKLIESGYFTAA